jgi:hypothetical protein
MVGRGLDSAGSGQRKVADFCEQCNELSGLIGY